MSLCKVSVKPALNAAPSFQIPLGLPLPEMCKCETPHKVFLVLSSFGSHIRSACKYLLHGSPLMGHLHSILSPTIHIQTFSPEATVKKPFVSEVSIVPVGSTHALHKDEPGSSFQFTATPWTGFEHCLNSFRLNFPISKIWTSLLSFGLLKITMPGCCYHHQGLSPSNWIFPKPSPLELLIHNVNNSPLKSSFWKVSQGVFVHN